jgi:hypothetical protein
MVLMGQRIEDEGTEDSHIPADFKNTRKSGSLIVVISLAWEEPWKSPGTDRTRDRFAAPDD